MECQWVPPKNPGHSTIWVLKAMVLGTILRTPHLVFVHPMISGEAQGVADWWPESLAHRQRTSWREVTARTCSELMWVANSESPVRWSTSHDFCWAFYIFLPSVVYRIWKHPTFTDSSIAPVSPSSHISLHKKTWLENPFKHHEFVGDSEKITLLRVIPTMTFTHFVTRKSSGILSDISSGILFGISSGICSGISSGILSGKFSGILSGISSGILSGKSSGILSGILCGKSSGIYSDISSGILSGILSDISSGIYSDISYMRSGREHVAWILAVEVRQGTLGVDGRGWGPAGNTGRGWSLLRSGREHWAWMVVVEVRQRTLGVDGRGWGPTENTVDRESQLSRRTRRTTRGGGGRGGGGPGNWHKI